MTKREAAIVSSYTGYLIGDIDDWHKYVQEILGRPVYTHELAFKGIQDEIHDKSKDDFCNIKITAEDLPCKVGDTVYCIHGLYNSELQEWQVNEISITANGYVLYLGHSGTNDFRNETGKYFNMWWFTNRKAAEARLKELQESQKNE